MWFLPAPLLFNFNGSAFDPILIFLEIFVIVASANWYRLSVCVSDYLSAIVYCLFLSLHV